MNFGHKITIVIVLFVAMIGTMVTIAVKQKDIFLVSKDYYAKEIAYQEDIDKMANTAALPEPIKLIRNGDELELRFPQVLSGAKGNILFYRPSNADLDFALSLDLDSKSIQTFDISKLANGLWVIKMDWSMDGKGYQKEEKIVI